MNTEIDSVTAIGLIKDHLHKPEHSWSIGIPGAIAEFMHDTDEEIAISSDRHSIKAVTPRGTFSVNLPAKLVCTAYEEFSPCIKSWSQQLVFCLADNSAKQTANDVLTELEENDIDFAETYADETWFDLGLGSEYLRFCIRTKDSEFLKVLRKASGKSIFDPENTVMSSILDKSPVRTISTKLASIEIRGKIPHASEMSPSGPHTHLLPKFLNSEKLRVPLPDNLIPLLTLYPSHPLFDKYGEPRAFDDNAYDHFQTLLDKYGLAEYRLEKARLNDSVQQVEPEKATSHWQRTAEKVRRLQLAHVN